MQIKLLQSKIIQYQFQAKLYKRQKVTKSLVAKQMRANFGKSEQRDTRPVREMTLFRTADNSRQRACPKRVERQRKN